MSLRDNQVDGPTLWRFPLKFYGATDDVLLFAYETIGENEVGISGVRLIQGPQKTFHLLVDDWLNQEPAGCDAGSGVGVISSV